MSKPQPRTCEKPQQIKPDHHVDYIRDHMQVHQTNKLTYLRVLGDHAEVNGNQLRRKSFRNCKIEQRVSTRA